MSIWKRLHAMKGKDAAAIAKQRDELAAASADQQAALAALRERLATGYASDGFDPLAISAEIRAAEDVLTAYHGAAAGLDRELAAAKERERMAALEGRAADGRKIRKQLLADYKQLHTLLLRVAELVASVRTGKRDLQAINSELIAAGRKDLETRSPLADLANRIRPQGGGLWRGVYDPASDELRIPGYAPAHPDGPDLAHLDKVAA